MNNQPSNTSKSPQILASRYEINEMVGQGSYSIVYKGYDRENDNTVAIKELRGEGMSREEAHEAQELFFNEINILKSLAHFALPRIYDFFYHDGKHFMVMGWIEGKTLLEILETRGAIPQETAIEYMKRITDILLYLQDNERKIIYKDIKPSNIILDRDGDIRLIDFGISRFYSPKKKKDTHLLGTPGYAPPEAYRETQTDFSADIYSLGATFYHLTTGEEPFQFKFKFPNPKKFNKSLSYGFSKLLIDMLKDRKKRIQNAKKLLNRIKQIESPFSLVHQNLIPFYIFSILIFLIIVYCGENALPCIFAVLIFFLIPYMAMSKLWEWIDGKSER